MKQTSLRQVVFFFVLGSLVILFSPIHSYALVTGVLGLDGGIAHPSSISSGAKTTSLGLRVGGYGKLHGHYLGVIAKISTGSNQIEQNNSPGITGFADFGAYLSGIRYLSSELRSGPLLRAEIGIGKRSNYQFANGKFDNSRLSGVTPRAGLGAGFAFPIAQKEGQALLSLEIERIRSSWQKKYELGFALIF